VLLKYRLMRSIIRVSLCYVGLIGFSAAYAQETKNGEYLPPTGEQPVYGKRYTPGASDAGIVLELNS